MANALQARDWLVPLLDWPIAILGAGVSGQAARSLADALGCPAQIYDEKSGDGFRAEDAARCRLVVLSPGIRKDHRWIAVAEDAGCLIVPEFDFASAFWLGPIVSVTGTNGKTTLTRLLREALTAAGIESYAVGNIGDCLSSRLAEGCNPEAVAVCEVSSFQAEQMRRFRSDYVIWTNFDEDHLDRHGSMLQYFESKYALIANSRGVPVFFDESVQAFAREHGFELPADGLVADQDDVAGLGIEGTCFEALPQRMNYLMARRLWLAMGYEESTLIESAQQFRLNPHRLERVGEARGVTFWDDSKGTNFHAVHGALRRFEKPVVWIGGGKDKGGNLPGFAEGLRGKLKFAALIGETAQALQSLLQEREIRAVVCPSMEAAFAKAFAQSESGDNLVLSPGFASFDMFDGYSHRGEAFKAAAAAVMENEGRLSGQAI